MVPRETVSFVFPRVLIYLVLCHISYYSSKGYAELKVVYKTQ